MLTQLTVVFGLLVIGYGGCSEIGYTNPACDGKQVIVHLFEWRWQDIALECERFLAAAGFCGVQTSPPNENHVVDGRPWWERYQPVSYELESRSGTRQEFVDMVQRCNAVGVRIFPDAVINHMAAADRCCNGTAGNSFSGPDRDFPAVPYDAGDFTPRELCPSDSGSVDNYSDASNVRDCNLVNLLDLYGSSEKVRATIAAYLNDLVHIGVAGFRVDASKHQWPQDLSAIMEMVDDLNTEQGFAQGTRPFFYHEVIDRNDGVVTVQEYYPLGRVTEFRYSQKITWGIEDFNGLGGVYDPGWGMADPENAFVFVDNHDNQRGHGGAGDIVTHTSPHEYRLAVAFTLAQPYGYTRIMSSFDFGTDTDAGPPHDSNMNTINVPIDDNNMCYNDWVCEHRWASIYKMVRFRNTVAGTDWTNYYNDGNVCAFARGDLGFFAMIKSGTLSQSFQTGMPAGTYEEVVSCQQVIVDVEGVATVTITNEEEPVFAICRGCSCDSPTVDLATPGPDQTTAPSPTQEPITDSVHRTVVFIYKQTNAGQDLFIRGGVDAVVRPDCTENVSTDPCSISITTNSLGQSTHYDKYNSWREGDNKLDWYGPESSQGLYDAQEASGTPLVWTSSSQSSSGYQQLNEFGDHYWMVDFDMDCSQTEDGWFELKAYLTNDDSGWEGDIDQTTVCGGTGGGTTPYNGSNHMAKCGFVNVFQFDTAACTINSLL